MLKRIIVILLMVAVAWAFLALTAASETTAQLTPVAGRYVTEGLDELGGANLVTSVVVTYRGLDTLGEVTVLFAAAAGVALVLGFRRPDDPLPGTTAVGTGRSGDGATPAGTDAPVSYPPSEILSTSAGVLAPLLLLFGVYIFSHGHLTPGGGFQGGVVVASALLLAFLGRTVTSVRHGLLHALEMVAGAGYVAIGLLGLWLAAGFLDPRFLPAGEMGSLLSAGAIPVIYSLVGIKVGSELAGVLDAIRRKV